MEVIRKIKQKWYRFWYNYHEGKGDEYWLFYSHHKSKADKYYIKLDHPKQYR